MDTLNEKAQTRFSRIPDDQSKSDGTNLDDRAFNDGMQDNNISAGKGFVHFSDGIRDSLKIDGGMRDEKRKITGYRLYSENCDFHQQGSR